MASQQPENMEFSIQLQQKARIVNDTLDELMAEHGCINDNIRDAISYTLTAGGKRIRAALVLWCCEVTSGAINRDAQIAAAAIEMVHTYSLVHDDLPAMDDDDLRRGKPACHKAFDEATAVLAGDALLTLAFEILAKQIDEPAVAVKLIGQLAQAAGPAGMIAGQIADLKAEKTPQCCAQNEKVRQSDEELLRSIHTNKTAKMFQAAAEMGALAGRAKLNELRILSEYGLKIGLGFQIADDILDVSATNEQLGKTAGKDAQVGKLTYPALVGLEKAKQLEKQLSDEAIAILEPLGPKADTLRQLATTLLQRTG